MPDTMPIWCYPGYKLALNIKKRQDIRSIPIISDKLKQPLSRELIVTVKMAKR